MEECVYLVSLQTTSAVVKLLAELAALFMEHHFHLKVQLKNML